MATIAEFGLPPETLPLGAVLAEFPEATVELERVVPTGESVRPYFWVEDVASATIAAFLDECSDIDDVTLVDTLENRCLFRHRHRRGENDVLTALVESDLTLLSATGTRDGWTLHVRGDERRAVAAFDERCRVADIPLTLGDLHGIPAASSGTTAAVTDAQREALVLAYERGYYAEPRTTTLATLADEVGISRQAFARRLQRGYRTLIRAHLSATAQEDVT